MSNALYPGAVKGLTYTVMKTPEWKTLSQEGPNGDTLRIAQMQNPLWHITLVYDYLYDTFPSANNTQAYAPYTDLQTLMGFYLARQGQFDDFLFDDPNDFSAAGMRWGRWQPLRSYPSGAVVIDLAGHAQLVTTAGLSGATLPGFSVSGGATSDGSVVWADQGFWPNGFPNAPAPLSLVTDAAGNYYSPLQRTVGGLFSEDITDLVPNTLTVYSAGVPVTGYTVQGPGLALPGHSYRGLYLQWLVPPAAPLTASFQFRFRVRFETDTQDFENTMQGLWTIGGSRSKNGAGYIKLVSSRSGTA